MALDLSLLPDKPKSLSNLPDDEEAAFQEWYKKQAKKTGINPDPDDPQHFYDYRAAYKAGAGPGPDGHWPSQFKKEGHPRLVLDGIDTRTGKKQAGLDLSLLPDQPTPETTPAPVPKTPGRPLASSVADLIEEVPGSTALKYLDELYGAKAPAAAPIIKGMPAARDLINQAGGDPRFRAPFYRRPGEIKVPTEGPRTAEQLAWEKDVNAMVESESLDLAKNLAGKRHPDLAAAQSGQKQIQLLADLGTIAASAGATGAVLEPVKHLPKVAKLISKVPRLARLVEAGAIGIPYTTLESVPKGEETIAEAFATYPQDVAKNVVGFMAFSAGVQLAGAAFDKVVFEKVVKKLPVRSMLLTRDSVRDYYALSGTSPEVREFAQAVPGFKELAAKTFKTGEDTMVVIPETTITRIAAHPWYQKLRQFLVSDIAPIPERTLFEVGGAPIVEPVRKALPATGQTSGGLDLSKLPDRPPAPPERQAFSFKFPEEAHPIKAARAKGLEDQEIVSLRYTDKRTGLLNQNFMEEVKTSDGKSLQEVPAVMVDMDNFGAINKKYGHAFGNAVLRDVGNLFKEMEKETGTTIVRDGGEEIKILLLKGEDPEEILDKHVESVRQKLGQIVYTDDVTGKVLFTGVNFSAGFGTTSERADKRLYEAKKAGKGRSWPIDKPELEMYNKIGGTKHELKRATPADIERPGAPEALPERIPQPGYSDVERQSDREIPPPQPPTKTKEVTQPAKKQDFDPTASYTPLLEDIIPKVKKTAGEIDVIKFIKRMGKVNPNLANSMVDSDIRELDDPSLIDEKNGKSLDRIRESLVESDYLPEDASVDDVLDLIRKQKRTGVKQYPILGGSDAMPPRPVSSLSGAQLDEAIKDFESLKAKRPLTEVESEIFSEVQESKKQIEARGLDLSLLPDQPARKWWQEAYDESGLRTKGTPLVEADLANQTVREAIELDPSLTPAQKSKLLGPETPDLSEEIRDRLIALSKAQAEKSGEPYPQVFEKGLSAFRQVVKELGYAGAMKLIEATERALDIQPEGDILKSKESDADTETGKTDRGTPRAPAVGSGGGKPLEGEPTPTLPSFEEVGKAPGGAPERAEPDRGGLPAGEGKTGRPRDGSGTGQRDRPGTGEGGVGLPPSGRGPAPSRQRELDRKTALEKYANHRITAEDKIGEGTPEQKYQSNIAAIKLLKQIELEGRPPRLEEMPILARYVGWGGMPQVFDEYNSKFEKKFEELKQLLTPEEYESARESTPNAHYTSPEVINSIYVALDRLGFPGGRVIEPAAGVGNFIGLMPRDMILNSRITMVELDSISGRIAKNLYGDEDVRIQAFETVKLPDNYFDAAVSNVPFGNYPVHDPSYQKMGLTKNIHNYFFAKTIDKIRPGGIVAFISSRFTMDSEDTRLRQYLSDRADLVGAIRLPNTAFKKNAMTEVVTDIIFLQKRETWQKPKDPSWVETTDKSINGESYSLNNYFVQHPDMMLGRPAMEGTQYTAGEFTLKPTGDLAQQLAEAVTKLQADIYKPRAQAESAAKEVGVTAPEFVKDGGLFIKEGKVYRRNGDVGEDYSGLSVHHLQSFLKVRDQLRQTMSNQLLGNEAQIPEDQKKLNKIYDDFTVLHGPLNSKKNDVFAVDPDYSMMMALEKKNKETGRYEKADIFSKRVLQPSAKIESVETSQEALFVALNETGKINFDRMEALTGKSRADLIADLKGSIYRNPESAQFETVEEYLSGNVRRKLEIAESAAKNDPEYKENVQALKEVQPKDLLPAQIKARLGSPWIPADVIDQFAAELFNLPVEDSIRTVYIPQSSTWAVDEGSNRWKLYDNIGNTKTWGTERYPAVNLISDTLNHKLPTVYDRVGGDAVVNKAETEAARDKQEKIKEKFQSWVMADPKRAMDLAAIYNRELNNIVLRTYDGKHLTLPGANRIIFEKLRKHQKNGIFRGLQGRNVLLAHAVGAGKTWEMAGIAMETKRIGLFKKSVITVPKNRLKATAAEFLQLYPSANILVADTKDLAEANRKVFKSRIATGDWDAIIISHDSFSRIRMSDATIEKFLDDKLAEFDHAIDSVRITEGKKGMSVKEMEKAKKRLETKLKGMMKQEKKDEGLSFEELGIDQIIVDEAQNYKSLALITQMQRVKGIPTSAADRAFDMFMKTEYLNNLNHGKGIVFATGTPVTNTIAEIYIMQRYLQNNSLKDYGIENFDAWAHTFGETVTGFELDATGKGFRPVSRFAKFSNIPELLSIFFQVADVQTAKMLNLPVPKLKGGAPQPVISKPSPELLDYIQKLMKRAERVRSGAVDKTEDNMLKISTDGRKAAMDMRLVDPNAKDYPDSKTNTLVDKVVDIWKANAKTRSVQLVFSDLGTPAAGGGFSVYEDVRRKLLAKGIPKDQIAFIYDAKTDDARKTLEDKVNSGQIRILLGSTPKMGLGMNVQERLVALNNLDVPWRPDWLEQRYGRIIRQGNLVHDEVQIFNYGTEKSFDAFMWQTVERKAKFISQVMSGEITAREVEDVDDVVLNFAQMKAITTGDPTILEKVELDAKIAKMQSLQTTYLNNQHLAHMEIANLPDKLKGLDNTIAELEEDLNAVSKYDPKNFKITIGGVEIDERVRAGEKIMLLAKQNRIQGRIGQDYNIGEFKGLPFFLHPAGVVGNPDRIHVQGRAFKYEAFVSDSPDGTIRSLDYQSSKEMLESKIKIYRETKSTLEKKLTDLEKEVKKPFPDEDSLKKMIARQQELEKKLDMSKGESTVGAAEEERPIAEEPEEGPAAGGGGAAMTAPSTKPQPKPGEGGEPSGQEPAEEPKNPVWPGAPNDFIPHIEMPELVRLARQIMGNIPLVRHLRRNLGFFKGARGEKLARISLDRSIFKDPVEATKLLAHEIGHLIDWLPNYTLARGNILGRLKSLQGYRKVVIDPLPTANDALNPLDRNKLKTRAIKEALSHTDYTLRDYIKSAQIRQAMKAMIKETYDDMVSKEIKRRGLVTKEQVMEELKAVTRYWHPFDPAQDGKYTAYRYSAKELYAEALSMLFNEPLRLKEMAPTFYKVFWDNLEKKPEVGFNLLELDELLGTAAGRKQILVQRSIDTREGYWKAEKLWYQMRMERSIRKRNFWLMLKDELIDRHSSLIELVKLAQKQGKKINPEDNPVYYLEEYNYLGGKIHNMLEDISKDVLEETARLGISQEDIGEYLERQRVIKERTAIANPLGQNIMTAKKSLEHLLSGFSDLQKKELEKAITNFANAFKARFKEMHEVGLISDENYAKYKDNDAYATFAVVDYLSDYISAGIIHQVGTFKEIANPLTASIMKMVSMKRAVEREKTRKAVWKFMQENFPDEIKEAEYKFIGMKGDIPIREPVKKEGVGILTTHENGKVRHWYVDPYIADSTNFTPQQFNSAIIRMFRWFNQGWFRPVYIHLNLAFQSANLIRDFLRGWKLNPDVSFAGHLMAYFRAAPAAYSRVWNAHPDKIIRDMREFGMLSITYNDMFKGQDSEDSQIEAIMRKYGVGPMAGKEKRNPFVAMMDFISDLGNFIETLPKVAGAQTRIHAGRIPMRQIAHEVRVYSGSPDFLRKGRGYTWYNELFLFSNAVKEGLRGDYEGAFADPRTRTGYWWKTTESILIPTALMFLAAAGFMGKKYKEMYDRVTEYDKTSYLIIPIGMTDNDQVVYLRVPRDEVGRLIGAIFWKMLNADKDFLDAAVQVAGLTAGQIPSQAPILDVAQTLTEYMIGRNPYDWFRGRQILTEDEQKVRGWPAAKKMGRWTLSKLGFSVSWGYFDKPGDSTIVKVIRYAPVISRYIKVTDYGLEEKKRKREAERLERPAERRIHRKESRRGKGILVR